MMVAKQITSRHRDGTSTQEHGSKQIKAEQQKEDGIDREEKNLGRHLDLTVGDAGKTSEQDQTSVSFS